MATELWAIGLVILCTLTGAVGPILLKIGSHKTSRKITSIIFNKHIIAGITAYGLSAIIFIIALKGGEVSVLYPVVSLSYIWVCLLSMKFLNEKMDRYKWLGIALIIIGVSFIGIGS